MKEVKTYGLILIAYVLLAVLFTWPLAAKIATHGFGHDEDAPYQIWHNWWFKYSLFDLKQSPLTSDYIFHPQKINLIYDANAFVFSTLSLPFQFLTGNVVLASNLVFLISFVLSGLFTFLLAKGYTLNAFPAFLAGFIFAFNPYTTAQAIDGHINLTTTWMIPLYTLLLIRSLIGSNPIKPRRPLAKRARPYLIPIAAGIVAALQLYNDFTYSAFMIIETVLIVAFSTFQRILRKDISRLPQDIKTIFLIAAVAAVLSLPLLREVLKAAQSGLRADSPLWVQNIWSTDLLSLVRPNDRSTFLSNPWTPNIGTVEGTAFVGYTVVGLILSYGLRGLLRKGKPTNKQKALENLSRLPAEASAKEGERVSKENLVVFLSLSFLLLMLGPSLHYRNNSVFNFFGREFIFPLPYLLLHKIPLVGETQEPARMFPFFILPLAILVAMLLKEITNRLRTTLSTVIISSFFFLLALEYLPLPFPVTDLSAKPVFDLIREDPEKKSVLILPLGFNSGNYRLGDSPIGSLQFYQVYHQKPSFRATVARLPYANFEYYQKLPLIPYLIDPSGELSPQDRDIELARKVFKEELHIKYVVVFENKYQGPIGQTYEVLENVLGVQKFYEEKGLRAYRLD